jgi:hypothetical protein
MFKGVNVARVSTMADGSIRLTIDLLDGNADDISAAFALMHNESSMLLAPTDTFVEAMQETVAGFNG